MRKIVWASLLAIAAGGFWAFMVVIDELYTLALYCRTNWVAGYLYDNTCKYPYPWTAPLDPYAALVHAFVWIGLFWFLSLVAFHKVLENGNHKTA